MHRNPSSLASVAAALLAALLNTGEVAAATTGAATAEQVQHADTARAAHVLNRLTFGARPGDLERVLTMGVDRWISEQLAPQTISNVAAERLFAALQPPEAADLSVTQFVRKTAATALRSPPAGGPDTITIGSGNVVSIAKPVAVTAAEPVMMRRMSVSLVYIRRGADVATVRRIAGPTGSERQLLEVLNDFWLNHFSMYSGKVPSRASLAFYERDAIRPHAMGTFRDLLGAAVRSPAMLFYLDNHLSSVDSTRVSLTEYAAFAASGVRPANDRTGGLNENFARELLELHTLGADGGYTQDDVIAVARAFTGWAIAAAPDSGSASQEMKFRAAQHDAEPKVVLGHTLAAGRGIEDGEEVLDILARHPSTARFVAKKLAVRLVSDTPPEELVIRAADTFSRTGGDINEIVRTIVTSPEFFDANAFRAKVKSPYELILSMRRALGLSVDTTGEMAALSTELNQPIWGRETPEGWPETGSAWMTSGAMFSRVALGMRVAQGQLSAMVPDSSATWRALANASFEEQYNAVMNTVLAGSATVATRGALRALAPAPTAATDSAGGRERLQQLLAVALSSPEFQRR